MTNNGPSKVSRHEECESRDKENELFVSLLSRNQSAIFGYILSLLPKWSDAEDVMQQTSMVLWQKFGELDHKSPNFNFTRWACKVAYFKVLNQRKKLCRDRHVFSEDLLELMSEEGMEDISLLETERRALGGCLEKLDGRQRRLVNDYYRGVNSVLQIAQCSGRTPNSIYKTLKRIREWLLRCVENALAAGGEL